MCSGGLLQAVFSGLLGQAVIFLALSQLREDYSIYRVWAPKPLYHGMCNILQELTPACPVLSHSPVTLPCSSLLSSL